MSHLESSMVGVTVEVEVEVDKPERPISAQDVE